MTATTAVPTKGDVHTFVVTALGEGHQPDWNNCPCKYAHHALAEAVPAGPHWTSASFEEEVAQVTYWMDNSIEVTSVTGKRQTVVAPHGDACF